MSGRDRRPRASEAETGEIAWTVVAGAVVAALLVSLVAVVTFVRALDIAPRVGDILVFRPNAHVLTDWEVSVKRSDGRSAVTADCVLRPDVMTADGGSLVVEERTVGPLPYRVHWAGQRTAIGGSNCGVAADLLVSRGDLQLLINVVGGPGVARRTFAAF